MIRHEMQFGSIREPAIEINVLIICMRTVKAQAQLGLVDSALYQIFHFEMKEYFHLIF